MSSHQEELIAAEKERRTVTRLKNLAHSINTEIEYAEKLGITVNLSTPNYHGVKILDIAITKRL